MQARQGWGEPENIFYDLLPGLKYDQEVCLPSLHNADAPQVKFKCHH